MATHSFFRCDSPPTTRPHEPLIIYAAERDWLDITNERQSMAGAESEKPEPALPNHFLFFPTHASGLVEGFEKLRCAKRKLDAGGDIAKYDG